MASGLSETTSRPGTVMKVEGEKLNYTWPCTFGYLHSLSTGFHGCTSGLFVKGLPLSTELWLLHTDFLCLRKGHRTSSGKGPSVLKHKLLSLCFYASEKCE